jgi:hypothetical protein
VPHSPAVAQALAEAREALARASRRHAEREAQALLVARTSTEVPPQASASLDDLLAALGTLRASLLTVEAVLERMGSDLDHSGLPRPGLPHE